MTTERDKLADDFAEFTPEELKRVLVWAYEGLLTTPATDPADRRLFDRLERMILLL